LHTHCCRFGHLRWSVVSRGMRGRRHGGPQRHEPVHRWRWALGRGSHLTGIAIDVKPRLCLSHNHRWFPATRRSAAASPGAAQARGGRDFAAGPDESEQYRLDLVHAVARVPRFVRRGSQVSDGGLWRNHRVSRHGALPLPNTREGDFSDARPAMPLAQSSVPDFAAATRIRSGVWRWPVR
jgi:hypothetical protein